jgi:hypothetical protein
MMGLSDTTHDKDGKGHLHRCQQFQTTDHLPGCYFSNQHTQTNPPQGVSQLNRSHSKTWTRDPIIFEESNYRSSITFSGDIFPLHFYQWRKEILCLILDEPPVHQTSFMLAYIEGEARSSLSGAQSKDQILRSLGILYGDIRSIMVRMTFAHQNLGKVPSCGVTRNHLIHLVNKLSKEWRTLRLR